eukprot:676519-Amorphochlora_amoeboformis.AAC.1
MQCICKIGALGEFGGKDDAAFEALKWQRVIFCVDLEKKILNVYINGRKALTLAETNAEKAFFEKSRKE